MVPEMLWALVAAALAIIGGCARFMIDDYVWESGDPAEYVNRYQRAVISLIVYLVIYGVVTILMPGSRNIWVLCIGAGALVLASFMAAYFCNNPRDNSRTDNIMTLIACYLVLATCIGLVIGIGTQIAEKEKMDAARFDKTVSYRLDADDKKMTDEAFNYPVTNLKINQSNGTYSWTERQSDNSLEDKTVTASPDAKIEVTVLNDLDGKAEPRVEHQVTYKLNSGAISSNGDRVCVQEIKHGDATLFPVCWGSLKESARFVKHHYIIHTPYDSKPETYK